MRDRRGFWWPCLLIITAIAPFVMASSASITSVDPPQGYGDKQTVVTATGEGLVPQSRVGLPGGGPFLLGGVDTAQSAQGTAVIASHAYVAGGSDGLYVIHLVDTSGPKLLQTLPTSGDAQDVASHGNLLVVVGSGSTDGFLELFNAEAPAAPVSIGEVAVPGAPSAVAAVGGHAYVTVLDAGAASLLVFDIEGAGAPLLVGNASFAGSANDVAVTGELALVASGNTGLVVLDISDPALPEPIGAFPTSHPALGVAASNETALIAAVDGLSLIDVSDPASPHFVGMALTPGSAVTTQGHHAFVTGDAILWSIDIGDPANPQPASRTPITGEGLAVAATADVACIAAGDAGAQVFDVRSPASPSSVIGRLEQQGTSILLLGNLAAMMDETQGLLTIDVTDPAVPEAIGYFPPWSFIHDPAGSAGIAGGGRFIHTGRWWLEGCSGSVCYPPGGLVRTLDLADPQNPVETNVISSVGKMVQGVASSESILVVEYLLPFTELDVFQLSDPAKPQKIATWSPGPLGGYPMGVAASERLALIVVALGSSGCRLDIIDTSLFLGPERIGSIDTATCPAFALGGSPLSVHGTLAAVIGLNPSGTESWLGLFDFSSPASPRLVSEQWFEGKATDVELQDGLALVATNSGLLSFDLREPSQPVLAGRYDTRSLTERVTIAGELAFATGESLSVVSLNPPLLDFQSSSDTQLQWTVPAGFASGTYDVLVNTPSGDEARARNSFRICEQRELESTLRPALDLPSGPGPHPIVTPLLWQVALEGDGSLFEPEPSHEAVLLLPELPNGVSVQFIPATELSIELDLGAGSGPARAIVRGPDEDSALATWEAIRQSGAIDLPVLDDRHYGDFRAMVTRSDTSTSLKPRGLRGRTNTNASSTGTRFRYHLEGGLLAGAEAWGRGADLLFRTSATYDGACEVQDIVGWSESIAQLCDELGAQFPNLIVKLCADHEDATPSAVSTRSISPRVRVRGDGGRVRGIR